MVRTAADRATGGKSLRKCGGSTPSKIGKAGGSSHSLSHGAGNSVYHRDTPEWQKPITKFFTKPEECHANASVENKEDGLRDISLENRDSNIIPNSTVVVASSSSSSQKSVEENKENNVPENGVPCSSADSAEDTLLLLQEDSRHDSVEVSNVEVMDDEPNFIIAEVVQVTENDESEDEYMVTCATDGGDSAQL